MNLTDSNLGNLRGLKRLVVLKLFRNLVGFHELGGFKLGELEGLEEAGGFKAFKEPCGLLLRS